MLIDVSDIVNDPMFAQTFSILRSSGTWVKGDWENIETAIQSYGAMQPATDRELQMLPEGDRISGALSVWSSAPLYTTGTVGQNDPNAHISDLILWHGEKYRVLGVKPWQDDGYYRAIATRMSGE